MDNMCILFMHHKTCDVTINNLNSLRKNNPNKKIITIGFDKFQLLDGSHVVHKNDVLYPNNNLMIDKNKDWNYWSEVDLLIYDFYIHHPNYSHYIITEWDVYCNCSAEDFYGDRLYSDALGHGIVTQDNIQDWCWYQFLTEEQKKIPNLGGIGPVLILFSNRVLKAITDKLLLNPRLYDNMFSELRMGTLVQQCGFKLKQYSDNDTFVSWKPEYIRFDPKVPGWYHPIKTLV